MTDLMIIMMFQDEITTGRKSNLCWRCLYYVTTNDCRNDTPASLQTSPLPASHSFILLLMILLSPLSLLSRQQIGQTRMKLSPVIRLVIRWQEVRWEQWCHPQSGLSEYFFADRQATRQHITPNWQYTFQPDKANLIFMKQNMQIRRQESSTVQY